MAARCARARSFLQWRLCVWANDPLGQLWKLTLGPLEEMFTLRSSWVHSKEHVVQANIEFSCAPYLCAEVISGTRPLGSNYVYTADLGEDLANSAFGETIILFQKCFKSSDQIEH